MTRILSRCSILIAFLILLTAPVSAQKQAKKKAEAAGPSKKVEEQKASKLSRFNPGNRPDPFFNYQLLKKAVENPDEEMPRGQPPLGIAGMYIAQVKLLGVVSGEDILTTVLGGTDNRAYFMQEKDKLFDGYIKKIEADSVVLIRETKLRSGKVITQEVVKRLRTP